MTLRLLRFATLALVAAPGFLAAAPAADSALPVKKAPPAAVTPAAPAASATKPVAATPEAPGAPGALPDGRQILRRFVDACGGAAVFKGVQSVELKGTISMPSQGMDGTLAIYQQLPNRVLAVTEMGPIKMAEGYDGKVGWANDPIQGPRILEGAELEQLKNAGGTVEVFGYANADEFFTVAKTLERTSFQGSDAWKVELVTKGGEEMTGYFDPATGLELGMDATVMSLMGEVPVTVVYTDWKEFGGIKIPTKMNQLMMGMAAVTTIESMRVNVKDLPSFSPPADVVEAAE